MSAGVSGGSSGGRFEGGVYVDVRPGRSDAMLARSDSPRLARRPSIRWKDPIAAVPAFLCMASQPFLFSVADGIYLGLASAVFLR